MSGRRTETALRALLGCAVLVYSALVSVVRADETVPDGVTMLLTRGDIPAVFEPTFVAASEAEITDDAWILGIVIDGEARAYSLNLLNKHEIVNDRLAGRPIAAVW